MSQVRIQWPDGRCADHTVGSDWLAAAKQADINIPTGCMGGSCGACEIEVNGTTVRACISTVPGSRSGQLSVEFASDPYW